MTSILLIFIQNNFFNCFRLVELLRSGKTSDKFYNQDLLNVANAAKSVGDAVAEAVNAVKGAAKQSE